MKITRSTKCSTKFLTKKKKEQLSVLLKEYGKIVNLYIDFFWGKDKNLEKIQLLKPIVNKFKDRTWLSYRLRKVAASEAIGMVLSVSKRWRHDPKRMNKPVHNKKTMRCSSNTAKLNETNGHFDYFLKLRSLGNKMKIDIPIKKHKHFNKLICKGKKTSLCIITLEYIQFSFEISTEEKKKEGNTIGIDTGIKTLATTSDGQMIGDKIENIISKIKNCKQGSNRQKRLRRYLRHYINESVKNVFKSNPYLCRIIVERLSNMNFKSKVNHRINKDLRKSIGSWNYAYWLKRLEMACEENCVRFTSINPAYTSITCVRCGHSDRANRPEQSIFKCVACNHTDHADINAAKNILGRGVSLVYRRGS
jgi:IS605 OrfB family transposase